MREALSMMSQSLDDPEGGMDGMMQVLSCDVSAAVYVALDLYLFTV